MVTGGSINQNINLSNCQKLNDEKLNLPANCVSPPTEFSHLCVNGIETKNMDTENVCPIKETVVKQTISECSFEHDKNIELAKNTNIFCDSQQQGNVTKLIRLFCCL